MPKRTKAIARRRYSVRRLKTRRRPKMTIPIAIVGGFVPPLVGVWARRNSPEEIGNYLQRSFTGIEPTTGRFNFANLRGGIIPIAAGFIVHVLASKIGINRALGSARMPLLRI